MKILHIDIETFSSAELSRCGVYRYAEAPDFEIKLFGYAIDDGPVHVVDLTAGEKIPQGVIDALTDPSVEKWAHHAEFERVCLSRFLRDLGVLPDGAYIDPWGWRCTMVLAAATNLPPSLAGAGKALGLPEQKLTEGRELIRKFCSPQKPTKANGGRTRILPEDDPGAWELFKAYCLRDVEVERKIYERLIKYDLPASEWALYELDQRINDRGIRIDADELCEQAVKKRDRAVAELTAKLVALTGLDNPSSVVQFKAWLTEQGITTASLDKEAVASLLAGDLPSDVRTALELRVKLSKSSLAKYDAMRDAVCADGRIRGTLKFYGAATTGRWAGRIVQPQNLPRTSMTAQDLDDAREFVRCGDYDAITILYGDVLDVLSQLIRTALVPAVGLKYIVSDYSAIEARGLAWLAGETWRLDAFRRGADIYCVSASTLFGVKVVKHGVNGHLRAKGKVAELALGYGGGVNAMVRMGALSAGLSEDELESIVRKWRAASPHVVQFWYDLETAAIEAVKWRHATTVHGIGFEYRSGVMWVTLPSGRKLAYCKPTIVINQFGRESVSYLASKGDRVDLYGGKLAENITQAVARDLLANSLTTLDARGYRVVCHVHDEVIIEAPLSATVAEVNDIMALVPAWAKGLPLKAEGFEAEYYKKD